MAVLAAGFYDGLEVDVRGSSGGIGRLDHGPWAAMLGAHLDLIARRPGPT
jgi:hypothetical protein